MRKIFYAFAVILGMSLSASCTKEIHDFQSADVTLSYDICERSSGSMYGTKGSATNSEIFDAFYKKIENGSIVADDYTLEFTEVGGSSHYTVTGKWSGNNHVSIKPGTYHVTGYATDSTPNIQANCSLAINDMVEVGSSGGKLTIKADYDCSLIIFHDESIKKIYNCNGKDEPKEFYKHASYHYAFVNTTLYDENYKDSAYILEERTDGTSFKTSTKNLSCENGKYYVYTPSSANFSLNPMEDGSNDVNNNNNDEGTDPVVSNGDTFNVTLSSAGTLSDAFSGVDPLTIKSIKISGPIDARDFNTLKWECRNLEVVDIANANIVSYYGSDGTNEGYNASYSENIIPEGAFFYWMSNFKREMPTELIDEGMKTLKKVVLPASVTVIERNAFARAYNLVDINIPEGVSCIGYVSFRLCTSLETISFPSTLTKIDTWAFTSCSSLKNVHIKATTPPTLDDSFGTLGDSDNNKGSVSTNAYTKMANATLYVPKGYIDTYKNSAWGEHFSTIVEE